MSIGTRVGGADRDRTDDPLLAKQVLSQLSYSPIMVGLGRFELPTSPLSGVRSNQLSYRPQSGPMCQKAHSPTWLVSCVQSFEDQVEHAEQLRRSRPSMSRSQKPEGLAGREGLIQAPLCPGGPGQEGDSRSTRCRSSPQSRIRKSNYAFLS